MNVNQVLAEKVMKWETDKESGKWIVKGQLLTKDFWNPSYRIEDAWTVLETFHEGLVRKRMGGLNYRAWVIHDGKEYTEFGSTACIAIVSVALRAHGIKV